MIVAKLVSFVLTVSMQHGLRMAHISVMKKTTVWAHMVFDPMKNGPKTLTLKTNGHAKGHVTTC